MRTLIFFLLVISVHCAAQKPTKTTLYFDSGSYALQQTQRDTLTALIKQIKQNKIKDLRITGYTDQTGQLAANQDLSEKRARVVKEFLLAGGVMPEMIIEWKGMGPATSGHRQKADAQLRKVDIYYTPKNNRAGLQQLEKGKTLVLENLDFIPGRHVITPESEPALQNLLAVLTENPNLKIDIQGHICCQPGTDGYDSDTGKNELSANRAKYVYNYLIKNGIAANRLSFRGFGRTRPLADPELTEEDRQKNRRVEILVLSN